MDEKFHAAIECDGSCTARFVQNAHISAGNGIFIHDVAMLSELTAAHQIIVGDKGSRKGEIIGGITRATMLVKAQNIGSSAYVKTVVIAGADKLLHERQNSTIKAAKLQNINLPTLPSCSNWLLASWSDTAGNSQNGRSDARCPQR